MDVSLLSTKYTIPPAGLNSVGRPRLLHSLDEGLAQARRLILVCAPAGYGKTALVSEWANRVASPGFGKGGVVPASPPLPRVAWLTCDPEDNDLARFGSYLVAALRLVNGRVGEGLLATLHASRPPTPQTLATLLINDLAGSPDRLVLVLDDFHCLTAQPVLDFIDFLVEHQSPGLCLVLVTRADPALPLARLRGRGQLAELRQHELAFTQAEAAEFFNRTTRLALSDAQCAALERRTEGWVAGLQLAALSIRTAPDVPAFIAAFSGGHEYIADYLADEVLAQQPESIQAFLLKTSILERLSAPLCAAVSGEAQAQEILETLREKNLFLVPLDHHKEWYRYHSLFADLLQNRLHQSHGDQAADLHRRASRWYQENAQIMPAIEHALAGQDLEQAAGLIEQTIESLFISGQLATMLRWLVALPVETKDNHPLLWIFHALALCWGGKSAAELKPILAGLAPAFTTAGLNGEADCLQALLAMTEGSSPAAARLARSALQELAPQRSLFRCLAGDILGMALILQSETQAAIQAFEQIVEVAAQAGFVMFEIIAFSHLAGLHLQQGQLHAAAADYQHALDLATAKFGRKSPATGNALLGLGELAREWGDLEGAMKYFSDALEIFSLFSEMGIPIAYLSMARVQASQGKWDSGQEYLEKARQAAQASKATRLTDRLVDGMQARLWIERGEPARAEQWAQDRGLVANPLSRMIETTGLKAAGSEFIFNDYVNLARLDLAQNRVEAALQGIASLLEVAGSLGYTRRVIQLLVLKAVALQQKKAGEPAVEMLEHALALAEPEGFRQVFIDEGEPVAQLLRQAIGRGCSPAYARKILAGCLARNPPAGAQAEKDQPSTGLLEPLSRRELEVLGLIAAGLSNAEITLRLHISLSTVKGHTANIYGKLGVNSRTQAVSEATRLRLLNN